MGFARISCGTYTAGHDVHSIAVSRTADQLGTLGDLSWDDGVVFTSDEGVSVRLFTHRPDVFEKVVPISLKANYLTDNHLLWVIVEVPSTSDENPAVVYRAAFNVSTEPLEPCRGTKTAASRSKSVDRDVLAGGN